MPVLTHAEMMLSPEIASALAAVLAALCIGGIVISLAYSRIGKRSEASRRFAAIAAWDGPAGRAIGANESARKRSIEATLRNIEEQQRARKGVKPSLTIRMQQAGLSWSKKTYFVACLVAGVVSSFIAFVIFGVSPLPALGFGVASGLLLPHFYVNKMRSDRFKNFTAEFPNAVDVIVRGVKAGLPLGDCLRIIAAEAKEPVRSEFRGVLDDQTLGVPMDQAVQRLPERIPVAEANFFAIVISLQSRSGGNLSEALGNLSKVLRERKKMAAKVRAMSSEAKASAGIIGALPVVVACLLYLSAPEYISQLFTTLVGKLVLAACAVWMAAGVFMMRKMINFDF